MADADRFTADLAARYRIESEIDTGGMATVYRAQDLKHDRTVAIKVLKPDLAEAIGADRFLREIRTTANLSHPHILPLFDSGEADGFLYYVMPFVEGESLADRLDREGQLLVEDAVQIAREVADALAFAHKKGVVHRDIKPANVMLDEGHALLMDFGIAQAQASADKTRLTGMGMSPGTPAYMSPEQISGQGAVDGRSDQYALACVLYEMLAGHPPFTAENVQTVMRQHLAAVAPKVTSARAAVPSGVAKAIHRGLAKTPADRYRTVAEFEKALAGATLPLLGRIPMGRARGVVYAVGTLVVAGVVWGLATRIGGPGAGDDAELGWQPDPNVVAVAPFKNWTEDSDSTLGGYLAARLSRGLSRADLTAEVLPDERVSTTLLGSGPESDPLKVLAQALGVGTVITGDVYGRGDSLEIQASIVDALSGEYFHTTDALRGPPSERESLIQSLQDRIAGALALYLDPNNPYQNISSPPLNPDAYAEFRRGNQLSLNRENWDDRADHYLRAWALDSTYLDAGIAAFWALLGSGRQREVDSVEAILSRAENRMTQAQRYQFYARETPQNGLAAQAFLEEARAASKRYPLEFAYDLGHRALQANRVSEALEAFRRWEPERGEFLEGFVNFPYYFHQYGEALHRLGRHREELDIILEGRRRSPDLYDLKFAELRARIGLGQTEEIQDLIAEVRRERGAPDLQIVARELFAHGLDLHAVGLLEEEVRRFETDPYYAGDPYRQSEVLHWLGRDHEAYALAVEVSEADPDNPWVLAWVGILAPFVGDTAQALEVDGRLAEWPREGVRRVFNFPWVRAQLHAGLGDRDGAVTLLEEVFYSGGESKIFSINDHITVELFPLRGYGPFEDLMRPRG